MKNWQIFRDDDKDITYILPLNDIKSHQWGLSCSCNPKQDENMIIHNSFDGREEHEKLFGTSGSIN